MSEHPYCEVAGCHMAKTAYYGWGYGTRSSSDSRPWEPDRVRICWVPRTGLERLCRYHSLQKYKVAAFGALA